MVIQPVFEQEPMPFALGVGVLTTESAKNELAIINALGEVLRVSAGRAIGFASDGSFVLISQRGMGFRPSLAGLHYLKGQSEAVFDTLWLSPRNNGDNRLSATHGVRIKNSLLPGKFLSLNPEYERVALTNQHGRRLTGYEYSDISPFHAGFAVARRTGTSGFVLLNRQGREVIPPRSFVGRLTNNRTLAASRQVRGQTELLDSTGQVIQSFSSYDARWLIEGDFLMAASPTGRMGFYDRNGQALLNGQEFAAVGEFWNNRLWVRTLEGREGLLDRHLRWAVPAAYEALYYPRHDGTRLHQLRGSDLAAFFYDTAYMVARQQQRYGQVTIRDGRVAVPIRFDSILIPLRQGFATVQRAGEPYVMNGQGRELTLGRADSEHAERRDGLWQAGVRRGQQTALFDEGGRQLCPWREIVTMQFGGPDQFLPRPGYDNLAIVFAIPVADRPDGDGPRLANLVNGDDQPQLPWRYQQIEALAGIYALRVSANSITQWELIDRQFRPLLSQPAQSVRLLPGGWLNTRKELIHESGQRIAVPSAAPQGFLDNIPQPQQRPYPELVTATQHFVDNTAFLPDEPFVKGIWRVEWHEPNQRFNQYAGYLTIHGRQLWEN